MTTSRPSGYFPISKSAPSGRPSARGTDAAREKSKAFRKREAERARRRRLVQWGTAAAAVLLIAVVVVIATRGSPGKSPAATSLTDTATGTLTGPPGPEGIVLEQGTLLAPASGLAQGATVDGVQCNSMEQAC